MPPTKSKSSTLTIISIKLNPTLERADDQTFSLRQVSVFRAGFSFGMFRVAVETRALAASDYRLAALMQTRVVEATTPALRNGLAVTTTVMVFSVAVASVAMLHCRV